MRLSARAHGRTGALLTNQAALDLVVATGFLLFAAFPAAGIYLLGYGLIGGLGFSAANSHLVSTALAKIFEKQKLFSIFDANVRNDSVLVVIGSIVMMTGLVLFVNRSRTGRGIRAVAQDMDTARLMGVNVDLIILITFLVGGLMAGAAAFFFEIYNGTARYSLGFELGVKAFTAAVLGGIGSLPGAMLGGLLIGFIEAFWSGYFSVQYKDVSVFAILVLVLIFRPTGLLGRPEIEKV